MPCIHFNPEVVCEHISRKGRCKKLTYPEGHPFCGHDTTLLALMKKSKKKKLNWKGFK